MKRVILYSILLILSGCTEKEQLMPDTCVPLTLSVNVSGSATRAVIDGEQFAKDEQLSVFLVKDPAQSGTSEYSKSTKYKFSGSVWKPLEGMSGLFLYNQKAIARAVYPSTSSFDHLTQTLTPTHTQDIYMGDLTTYYIGDGGSVVSDLVVKMGRAEQDFMTGTGAEILSASESKSSTSITMRHSMAMVAIKIIKDDSYFGDTVMSWFSFTNTASGTKPMKNGTVNIADNSFSPGATEVYYYREFTGHDLGDYIGFLVYPADIAPDDIDIFISIDDLLVSVINTKPMKWEAGKLTIINVTLSSMSIDISSSITVHDWPIISTEKIFVVE